MSYTRSKSMPDGVPVLFVYNNTLTLRPPDSLTLRLLARNIFKKDSTAPFFYLQRLWKGIVKLIEGFKAYSISI